MNRIDLTKLLRQVSANMDPGHEGVGMDIKTAKRQVDKLIEDGFLTYVGQNLEVEGSYATKFPGTGGRPVTVTFMIEGDLPSQEFMYNLSRMFPTTKMCLGPVSNMYTEPVAPHDKCCVNCRFNQVVEFAQGNHRHSSVDDTSPDKYGFNVCQNKHSQHHLHVTGLRHCCADWEYQR